MTRHKMLIVDDHPLVRRGVRSMLEAQPDFQVIGEAGDCLTALQMVDDLLPDVVVLDIVMPLLGGLDLLRELAHSQHRPRVVVLSLHDDPAYVEQAARLGAAGYILKHSASTFLVPAVRNALVGRFFSSCTPNFRDLPAPGPTKSQPINDRRELLNADEKLVLRLFAEGQREEEIQPKLKHQPLPLATISRNIAIKLGLPEPGDVQRRARDWSPDRS